MDGPVLLLGPDQLELGRIATASVGPELAVAISCGFHPKRQPALDGNEDAAAALRIEDRLVLVVADGHYGFDAARSAVTSLLGEPETWIGGEPEDAALAGMRVAAAAVAGYVARLAADADAGTRRHSATALGVAVATGTSLGFAVAGDVAVVVSAGRRASRVSGRAAFLGLEPSRPVSGSRGLAGVDAVIVASDGLTDFLPRRWSKRLPRLVGDDAESSARRLVAAAGEGGAGDNVAVGVLLPQGTGPAQVRP